MRSHRSACSHSRTSAPPTMRAHALTTYWLSDARSMGPPTKREAANTAVTSARCAVCLPFTGPPQLHWSRASQRRPQAARANRGSVGCKHPPSLHTVLRGASGRSSAWSGIWGSALAAASAKAASWVDIANTPVRPTPAGRPCRTAAGSSARGVSNDTPANATRRRASHAGHSQNLCS